MPELEDGVLEELVGDIGRRHHDGLHPVGEGDAVEGHRPLGRLFALPLPSSVGYGGEVGIDGYALNPLPWHGQLERVLVREGNVGALVHPPVFLEEDLGEVLRQRDGSDLVAGGVEHQLLLLGEEEESRDEYDIGVERKIAEDGLGLVGEAGLPLDGLGEGSILDLAEAVALREGTYELIDVDAATHGPLW